MLVLAAVGFALVACTHSPPPEPSASPAPSAAPSVAASASPTVTLLDDEAAKPSGAQPELASDPAQLADDLVADEQALRDPSTPEAALQAAARRQQAAYRAIGRDSQLDATTRPRIPPSLLEVYDLNVDARRQLTAMAETRDAIPVWRIVAPAPADELLAYYREAEAASGVGWNYLAAINLIETRLGSVVGPSSAGAQGPMQFLPSTFAAYGDGGDIYSPRDSHPRGRPLPRRQRLRRQPRPSHLPVQPRPSIRAGRQRLRGGACRRSRSVHRLLPLGRLPEDDRG